MLRLPSRNSFFNLPPLLCIWIVTLLSITIIAEVKSAIVRDGEVGLGLGRLGEEKSGDSASNLNLKVTGDRWGTGSGKNAGEKKERIFLGEDSLLSFSYGGAGGRLSVGGGFYGGSPLGGYPGFGLGQVGHSHHPYRPFSLYGPPGPILSGGIYGTLGSYGGNYISGSFGFPGGFHHKYHKHHFSHGHGLGLNHGFSHYKYHHGHHGLGGSGFISPFTSIY